MTTKLQNYRERHHAQLNGRTYGSACIKLRWSPEQATQSARHCRNSAYIYNTSMYTVHQSLHETSTLSTASTK